MDGTQQVQPVLAPELKLEKLMRGSLPRHFVQNVHRGLATL